MMREEEAYNPMALCPGCGNEVLDPTKCAVCKAGRGAASAKTRREERSHYDSRCSCPRCNEYLEEQSWEGTATLSCPNCRGTFFPGNALETVLDKLRATVDPVDADTVLREFKDRFTRQLPNAVRYKGCPVCAEVMIRRAYGTVSGVIIDLCSDHGSWVDESQFAALADFICRGGDLLANEIDKVRARITRRSGPTLLDKFLGNR